MGVVGEQQADGVWQVEGRNRFQSGEVLEIIGPELRLHEIVFQAATGRKGEPVTTVQPNAVVSMALPDGVMSGDLLRRWRRKSS